MVYVKFINYVPWKHCREKEIFCFLELFYLMPKDIFQLITKLRKSVHSFKIQFVLEP